MFPNLTKIKFIEKANRPPGSKKKKIHQEKFKKKQFEIMKEKTINNNIRFDGVVFMFTRIKLILFNPMKCIQIQAVEIN